MKRKASGGGGGEDGGGGARACRPGKEKVTACDPQVATPTLTPRDRVEEFLLKENMVVKDVDRNASSFGEAIRKGFASLWESRLFADCVLDVAGTEILSHRALLVCWSEVFEAALERWAVAPPPLGAGSGPVRVAVELLSEGDTAGDFEEVLRYMYTGACSMTSYNVMALLRISNFYEVTPLKELCGEFLFDLLSERYVSHLIDLSERYSMSRLRRLVGSHLAHNFEQLMEVDAMWDLNVDTWEEVLACDHLAVEDEAAALGAARAYVATRPAEERTATMGRLLPFIRLPLLGADLLISDVEGDTWLMSLPGARGLVYNAFRQLLAPGASQAALPAPEEAGASGSGGGGGGGGGAGGSTEGGWRLAPETLALQAAPRLPLLSFDSKISRGFELSNGRLTATSAVAGGLRNGPALDTRDRRLARFARMDAAGLPNGPIGQLLAERAGGARGAAAAARAGAAARAVRAVLGDVDDMARDLPGDLGDGPEDAARSTCYAVASPGLAVGAQTFEIEVTGPAGPLDVAIWVVKNPALDEHPPSLEAIMDDGVEEAREPTLSFEQRGAVYSSESAGGGRGAVRRVVPNWVPEHLIAEDHPVPCDAITSGDVITVQVAARAAEGGGARERERVYALGLRHRDRPGVSVSFSKGGREVARKLHLVHSELAAPPPPGEARRGLEARAPRRRAPLGAAAPRAPHLAAGAGGGVAAAAAGGRKKEKLWRLMVSTSTPNVTVTLKRPPVGGGGGGAAAQPGRSGESGPQIYRSPSPPPDRGYYGGYGGYGGYGNGHPYGPRSPRYDDDYYGHSSGDDDDEMMMGDY